MIERITHEQAFQLGARVAQATHSREDLEKDEVQRALGNVDFSERAVEFIKKLGKLKNPYASEQCEMARYYPKRFAMPPLGEQAERLQQALGFEPKWDEAAQNLPFVTGDFGADGIALFPCLSFLGKVWEINDPYLAGYGKLIATTCERFGEWSKTELNAPLVNHRMKDADELTPPGYVRIVPEVKDILVLLEEQAVSRGYNCLAMPVCLGDWGTKLCYSPRNALWHTLNIAPPRLAVEPVAGVSLVVGTKVLTAYEHQWKVFPGAQYNWDRVGGWSYSLYLGFDGGRFHFDARAAHCASGYYGSMVAFPGESGLVA